MTRRAQGYRAVRREIDVRQRQFDREPMTLTPLRIARFTALERMYTAALLVAAAADAARIAVPEGMSSWVDEIAYLQRVLDGNMQRLRDAGWSNAEMPVSANGRSWEPEPDAFAARVPNGSRWVDNVVVVVGDSDGDAGEIR